MATLLSGSCIGIQKSIKIAGVMKVMFFMYVSQNPTHHEGVAILRALVSIGYDVLPNQPVH